MSYGDAEMSIRQHTSAYVFVWDMSYGDAEMSIRQHSSAYVFVWDMSYMEMQGLETVVSCHGAFRENVCVSA
jgi:hypothetical protein